MKRLLIAAGAAVLLSVSVLASPASAASNSVKTGYPDNHAIRADIWLGAGQTFGWQSTAYYEGSQYPIRAQWIRDEVFIKVNGVSVSLGNASGGTNSDRDFGQQWTNTNTWVSTLTGTNRVSNNFYFNITGTTTATSYVPFYGAPRSAAAVTTKWA